MLVYYTYNPCDNTSRLFTEMKCDTHVQRVAYPQNFITNIIFKEIKQTTKILTLKILGYMICYVEYM